MLCVVCWLLLFFKVVYFVCVAFVLVWLRCVLCKMFFVVCLCVLLCVYSLRVVC